MSIQSDGEVEALFPITDPDEHERELVPYATVSPAVRDPNFSTEDRCPICGGTTDGLPCLQAPLEARIAAGEKLMSDQKPPERIWIQHYDDYAGIKKVGHGYYYWTKPQLDSDSIEYVPAATVAVEWQPIETAPTNGTPILAYPVFHNVGVVTWWRSGIHRDGGSFINGNMAVTPTHWMPLPKPPAARAALEGRRDE